MNENTDADELERSLILMRVSDKQPKVFMKWVELKEKFGGSLGLYDSRDNPLFTIYDVFEWINEAFDNDNRQPALID